MEDFMGDTTATTTEQTKTQYDIANEQRSQIGKKDLREWVEIARANGLDENAASALLDELLKGQMSLPDERIISALLPLHELAKKDRITPDAKDKLNKVLAYYGDPAKLNNLDDRKKIVDKIVDLLIKKPTNGGLGAQLGNELLANLAKNFIPVDYFNQVTDRDVRFDEGAERISNSFRTALTAAGVDTAVINQAIDSLKQGDTSHLSTVIKANPKVSRHLPKALNSALEKDQNLVNTLNNLTINDRSTVQKLGKTVIAENLKEKSEQAAAAKNLAEAAAAKQRMEAAQKEVQAQLPKLNATLEKLGVVQLDAANLNSVTDLKNRFLDKIVSIEPNSETYAKIQHLANQDKRSDLVKLANVVITAIDAGHSYIEAVIENNNEDIEQSTTQLDQARNELAKMIASANVTTFADAVNAVQLPPKKPVLNTDQQKSLNALKEQLKVDENTLNALGIRPDKYAITLKQFTQIHDGQRVVGEAKINGQSVTNWSKDNQPNEPATLKLLNYLLNRAVDNNYAATAAEVDAATLKTSIGAFKKHIKMQTGPNSESAFGPKTYKKLFTNTK